MDYREHATKLSILPHPIKTQGIRHRMCNHLLPGSCLLCSTTSGNDLLCADCRADLPPLPAATCPICAEQTTHGERCGACLRDPPNFGRTVALFRYDFPLDRLIHALKYGHQLAVAPWCATQLAAKLRGEHFDAVIPLPLHPARLQQRGFNQAAEIARHLGNHLRLDVDRSSLIRQQPTQPQANLPLAERRNNVRGAFECRTDFSGRHLLLLDDVLTTGATANECARVLRLHGAASVTVAVVARALKD